MKNHEVGKACGRKAEVWIQIMALQLSNIVTKSKLPVSLCPGSLSVKRRQITETLLILWRLNVNVKKYIAGCFACFMYLTNGGHKFLLLHNFSLRVSDIKI